MSMNLNNVPKLDKYGVADKIIPFVPTLALIYLVLAAVGATLGFLGALFTFSLVGMVASIGALAMAAAGYAAIMMLHGIYRRVVG